MKKIILIFLFISAMLLQTAYAKNSLETGSVVTRVFESEILKDTKVAINPSRSNKIYLPPGYETSQESYPVIYYQHGLYWDNERMFENGVVKAVIDRSIQEKIIPPVIMVFPDYTNSFHGTVFQNNPVSGRWLEYVKKEVVTFVDKEYRTIKHRDSRAVAGDFWGGYGSLKLAMTYPDTFGSVYAMHPVATGIGLTPSTESQIWPVLHSAKNYKDIEDNIGANIYLSMAQAYLPNAKKPPFYADFWVDVIDGQNRVNIENMKKFREGSGLDKWLPKYVDNLKKLNAIKMDWARYDITVGHVTANQQFTVLLDEYGIDHEAEEYRGDPFGSNWGPYGRITTDVFPFFKRNLKFKK